MPIMNGMGVCIAAVSQMDTDFSVSMVSIGYPYKMHSMSNVHCYAVRQLIGVTKMSLFVHVSCLVSVSLTCLCSRYHYFWVSTEGELTLFVHVELIY